nr:ATP-binding cassette domain-containing protein [Massilia forsythiae]
MEAPLIRLQRVAKAFAATGDDTAACQALRDVSLDVHRGDIFGIAGRSGAGKSTLLRMINLLETPDSGAVIVGGRDLTRLSRRDLRAARRGIGMVFQQYSAWSSSTTTCSRTSRWPRVRSTPTCSSTAST